MSTTVYRPLCDLYLMYGLYRHLHLYYSRFSSFCVVPTSACSRALIKNPSCRGRMYEHTTNYYSRAKIHPRRAHYSFSHIFAWDLCSYKLDPFCMLRGFLFGWHEMTFQPHTKLPHKRRGNVIKLCIFDVFSMG